MMQVPSSIARLFCTLLRRRKSRERRDSVGPTTPVTPGAPRWQNALARSLGLPENNKEYSAGVQLATLDDNGIPRVRTIGYRGIIHPEGSPNLPVFVFSTDVRMQKAVQIQQHPHVEFVWWFRGSNEQYRVSGAARVVTYSEVDLGPAGSPQEECLALDALDKQGYGWEKKFEELYNEGDDDGLRASLNRPPPGSRIPSYETAHGWVQEVPKLGQANDNAGRRNQEEGLRNSALLLVEAIEVDWCELALRPHQRTKFKRDGDQWEEWPVVP